MKKQNKNLGMVYEITTANGYGYCQFVHPSRNVITGSDGKVTLNYEGMDIVAIFPGEFNKQLNESELIELLDKKPLDHCLAVLPKRKFPEEMSKLKAYPIGDINKDFPVMKLKVGVNQETGKAEFWVVLKNFNEPLFKGEDLPDEYINSSEIRIVSIGSIIDIIEKQKQPKDSTLVTGVLK